MKSQSAGRTRHTADERAELLAGFHRSGLTQARFAERNGLGLSCLRNWLSKARAAESTASRATLLPLPVNLAAAGPAGPAYRIGFPGGHSLEVGAGFRVDELRELCQLLRGL